LNKYVCFLRLKLIISGNQFGGKKLNGKYDKVIGELNSKL